MVRFVVLFWVACLIGFSTAYAGSPQVTEKSVVLLSDGSYAMEDKAAKDEIQILEVNGILALSDDKLLDAYMDVVVELEALKVFHATSGFAPKEFKKYKSILKYRLRLAVEIQRRKLELPPISY